LGPCLIKLGRKKILERNCAPTAFPTQTSCGGQNMKRRNSTKKKEKTIQRTQRQFDGPLSIKKKGGWKKSGKGELKERRTSMGGTSLEVS